MPLSPPWTRWLVLAALLLGEILLVTFRFDTQALDREHGWWAALLSESPLLLRLLIAVTAATLLLGGAPLWHELQSLSVPSLSPRRAALLLVVHAAIFTAFFRVTAVLLEERGGVVSKSTWLILWIILGVAMVGLLALVALPAPLWLRLLRRLRLALLAGFAIGAFAWGAGLLLQELWLPLAEMTLNLVRVFLSLFYSNLVYEPDTRLVGTSTFSVFIAPECSGYEGMGLLSVFVAAYLWLFRRGLRFPHALLLWPIGVVLLWLLNAVRITVLIAIGSAGWPKLALGGFHSQAGWLAFNAVALGLAVVARRQRFFASEPIRPRESAQIHPATAYLTPFLVILATTMLTAAFTEGFDLFYPLRVVAAGIALWCCRRGYAELRGSWSWQPFALGAAMFVLWIALVPSGIGEPSMLRDGLEHLRPFWATIWLIFRILGAVVTVPLAEELAFRGYLLRRLQSADWHALPMRRFSWLALIVSSVLFGLMHSNWLAGTLAGLVYAGAVYCRGRLGDAVLAHATTNALLAAYVLATGAWGMW